jgi:hypothetical protein
LLKRADRLVKWPRDASLGWRAISLGVALLTVAGIAWLIAETVWRDELPRSTIAAGALAAVVLLVLWLFGPSGWKTALGILSAMGAILIAAGTALNLDQRLPDGPAPRGALVDCPDYPEGHLADGYVASTELGYALVRGRPNLHSGVLLRYPPGCRLAFDGYCLGEPKDDWRFDVLDPVWFTLATTEGYVPSADIRAGPAGGSLELRECPGGQPLPRPPELTAPTRGRLTGPVEIAAAAPRAIQVGFAVYYPEVSGRRESAHWHQIGVDLNTGDGATASWDSRSVPGQGDRRPASVTLLAVPCLGLEFPAEAVDQRTFVVANGGGPKPQRITPPSESTVVARQLACDNVER